MFFKNTIQFLYLRTFIQLFDALGQKVEYSFENCSRTEQKFKNTKTIAIFKKQCVYELLENPHVFRIFENILIFLMDFEIGELI